MIEVCPLCKGDYDKIKRTEKFIVFICKKCKLELKLEISIKS